MGATPKSVRGRVTRSLYGPLEDGPGNVSREREKIGSIVDLVVIDPVFFIYEKEKMESGRRRS